MNISVFQVVARRKKKHISPFQRFHHDMKDFTLINEGMISADNFLERKDIIPYWIDFKKKEVIFSAVENVSQLSHASFISDAIYESSRQLFFIPFSFFIALSLKIQSLKTEIVVAAFTPRSGSTLICKIISKEKSVFTVSEPICLNLIERHYSLQAPFGEALFKAIIIFLSSFAFKQEKKILYIKPFILSDVEAIDRIFQIQTKKIVTWRSAFETMRSLAERRPMFQRRIFKIFKLMVHKGILSFQPLDRRGKFDFYFNDKNTASRRIALIFSWVLPMMELVKHNPLYSDKLLVFHYDDLINYTPHKVVSLILDHLCLPMDSLEEMMLELNYDSQAGTPMGRDKRHPLSLKEKKEMKNEIEDFITQYTLDLALPRK